jgi:hypothetical protein
MRLSICFVCVFALLAPVVDEASAASRRGSGTKSAKSSGSQRRLFIEPNTRYAETAIHSLAGRNASAAAKYFTYLSMSGR